MNGDVEVHYNILYSLVDPGGLLGPGPPTLNIWEFFTAK